MHQYRPVPQVHRQRQQFALPHSPMGQPSPPDISEQVQDLAMEIYSQLAVDYLRDHQEPEPRHLETLAARAQAAALAYFRQLGVRFDG